MTTITQLKALAEKAGGEAWYFHKDGADNCVTDSPDPEDWQSTTICDDTCYYPVQVRPEYQQFIAALNPERALKLLELVEMQHEALKYVKNDVGLNDYCDHKFFVEGYKRIDASLDAFNNFNSDNNGGSDGE